MAVTLETPQRVGPGTWLIRWSSDLPGTVTYRVYVDGALVDTTTARQKLLTLGAGESPVIEVLDDPDARPISGHPSRLTLAWYAPSGGVAYYRVEEQISLAWVEWQRIYDHTSGGGQGYFTWRSRVLEDGAVHRFRVVPVGSNGNEGTPQSFEALMVRHPDPPRPSFAYSGLDGAVTITGP